MNLNTYKKLLSCLRGRGCFVVEQKLILPKKKFYMLLGNLTWHVTLNHVCFFLSEKWSAALWHPCHDFESNYLFMHILNNIAEYDNLVMCTWYEVLLVYVCPLVYIYVYIGVSLFVRSIYIIYNGLCVSTLPQRVLNTQMRGYCWKIQTQIIYATMVPWMYLLHQSPGSL